MTYTVSSGRIKPKKQSTFGKKPYKGKVKNRKGSKKVSYDGTLRDPLNSNKPVRFNEAKYKKRQDAIRDIELCQVCNESYELDAPHHVEQGSCKDDRYLINICIYCHALIHNVGYSSVKLSRKDCSLVALSNHIRLEKEM